MDKIYIVVTSGGTYEDRWEMNHKAFYKKEDATCFVEMYNKNLKNDKEQSILCDSCYPDEGKFNILCSKKDLFEDKEDGCVYCKNYIDSYVEEEYDAIIEEMEIQ